VAKETENIIEAEQANLKLDRMRVRHSETLDELKRYKSLVESVQDYAIFLMDKNGYIQTWNKGAQKTKGYKPDEIIGQHFSIFYPDVDIRAGKPERELEEADKFGRVEDEGWRIRKDGSMFWANVIITALYDTSDRLVGFAKVTRDQTQRKEYEDELKRMNASKDEFISLASHQLRTPATSVKQYLGMVLEGFVGDVPTAQRELLARAYENNERQLRIINDLLKVAQIDAGKLKLRMQEINPNELVSEVVEEQRQTAKSRGHNLSLQLSDDNLRVILDPDAFRMALENIIDNAGKYSEGGDNSVTVTSNDSEVKIAIADQGVGVGEDDLPRLFQKFVRIDNPLSTKVGGTGLGLYWAKRIVDLHDGRIHHEPNHPSGSVFVISLPLSRQKL
jgi:PAS domain S-box-containing protein